MGSPRPWLPREIALAANIFREKAGVNRVGAAGRMPRGSRAAVIRMIAEALGCNIDRVENRLHNYGPSFDRSPFARVVAPHGAEGIPERVLRDKSQRALAADRRDITATVFGDPPPGYSALDRRKAAGQSP